MGEAPPARGESAWNLRGSTESRSSHSAAVVGRRNPRLLRKKDDEPLIFSQVTARSRFRVLILCGLRRFEPFQPILMPAAR